MSSSKKDQESFIDYRKRVLDPISKTFCGAKWLNSTIWLGNGSTSSCHLPPAHRIPLKGLDQNPSGLHNTPHKKMMRRQMLKGQRPVECEYCWKIEDLGRDHMSDRTFKSSAFSESDLKKCAEADFKENIKPRTLEISFSRTCNFACGYCNSGFSSKWGAEIQTKGPYQNLVSDGRGPYRNTGKWAEVAVDEDNPYVKAFWNWWPELKSSLHELRVTGGEPLLSPSVWKLLDEFSSPDVGNVRLAINSNLGSPDELITKLIHKSQAIKELDIYTSCEAFGAQAEYMRYGLNFKKYCENVERLMESANYRQIHMMMTINALSLDSITEFLDMLVSWKSKYGEKAPRWTCNILRFPSFMSLPVLPDMYRLKVSEQLKNWIQDNRHKPYVFEYEIEGLRRIISYLEEVAVAHSSASDVSLLRADFRSFFDQYDQRRDKNFVDTFPSLKEWYLTLSAIEAKVNLSEDGDNTFGFHNYEALRLAAKQMGIDYDIS